MDNRRAVERAEGYVLLAMSDLGPGAQPTQMQTLMMALIYAITGLTECLDQHKEDAVDEHGG